MNLKIFSAFLLLPFVTAAQESGQLLLLNGTEINVKQVEDSGSTEITYRFDKNQFRRRKLIIKEWRKTDDYFNWDISIPSADKIPVVMREGSVPRDEVYSFEKADGPEEIYYFYDPFLGNDFTVEEMEAFVVGSRDARYTISGRGWFWGGMAVGAGAGYLLRLSVFSLAVPPVVALSARIPTIHIKPKYISDMRFQYNEYYAAGFEAQARSKNTIEALKGSALGTALGIVAFIIVENNN